jgi:tetratricopeptide (TPR) repeat protein
MPLRAEGEFALVTKHLETALQIQDSDYGDHDLYAWLVDAAAQQRDTEALRRYAPEAEALATRYGHRLYQAIAQRAWGVLHRLKGDHASAESRLRQALASFTELNTRWQMARTFVELAELASIREMVPQAIDDYVRALDLFEAIGARPSALQVRSALARLGETDLSSLHTSHH